MFTMSRKPRTTRVVCRPCDGSGVELALRDRQVVERDCFWCDGRGYHEHDTAPARCPACNLVGVVVAGDDLCPDCTRWELTALPYPDAADFDPDGPTEDDLLPMD